jgi:hypothetical protein
MSQRQDKVTAGKLKDKLWETLNKLSSQKIPARDANSISNNANSIMGVVRAQIALARLLGTKPKNILDD